MKERPHFTPWCLKLSATLKAFWHLQDDPVIPHKDHQNVVTKFWIPSISSKISSRCHIDTQDMSHWHACITAECKAEKSAFSCQILTKFNISQNHAFSVSMHLLSLKRFAFTFCTPNSIGMLRYSLKVVNAISRMVWLTIRVHFHSVTPLQTIHAHTNYLPKLFFTICAFTRLLGFLNKHKSLNLSNDAVSSGFVAKSARLILVSMCPKIRKHATASLILW